MKVVYDQLAKVCCVAMEALKEQYAAINEHTHRVLDFAKESWIDNPYLTGFMTILGFLSVVPVSIYICFVAFLFTSAAATALGSALVLLLPIICVNAVTAFVVSATFFCGRWLLNDYIFCESNLLPVECNDGEQPKGTVTIKDDLKFETQKREE